MARLLGSTASHTGRMEPADRAVLLSPSDAESHSSRALAFSQDGQTRGAISELESAVVLRPRDYLLWLQLGRARDEAGESDKALAALQEALRLAPYYSEPRWQYGNLLYRRGQVSEAFPELTAAAQSDPTLAPALMDLVWGTYSGDAAAVERIVAPRTNAARISLARFFVKKGKISEALELFRSVGNGAAKDQQRLLGDLLRANQFGAAHEVWAAGQPSRAAAGLTDPGFEGPLDLNTKGFAWRQERPLEGLTLSLDPRGAHSGSSSLLVEWKGHATPEVPALTQLVIVQPHSHYRLKFFVRTAEVITGGLPIMTITEAGASQRTLAQSKPFPEGTSDWHEYEVEFETTVNTEAVYLTLQRQTCPANPCPMFGRVWLDDFALVKEP
jgi:tetratricopeptide (TPR) repeat protein